MPNPANILRPVLIVGAGRTASTYVIDRLQYGQGDFYNVVENEIYREIRDALTKRYWSHNWKFVAGEAEIERRLIKAVRDVLLAMFPSELPEWAMKLIWYGHDVDYIHALFPEARYLHLTRNPRSNLPSMLRKMGADTRVASNSYVWSNENALEFARFKGRYLQVKQEDLIEDQKGTWSTICEFLGVRDPGKGWDKASKEATNATTKNRAPGLRWDELTDDVQQMALELGYKPAS